MGTARLVMLLVVIGSVAVGVLPAQAAAQADTTTLSSTTTSVAPTATTLVPASTATSTTAPGSTTSPTSVAAPGPTTTTTTTTEPQATTATAPPLPLSAPASGVPTDHLVVGPEAPGSSGPEVDVDAPPPTRPAGPVPLPAQSLSAPGAKALVESLEAFVGGASRVRAAAADAQAVLDDLEGQLDERRRDQEAAEAAAWRVQAELARAEAQLGELERQRREAARHPSPPPRTVPGIEPAEQLVRVEAELGRRVAGQRLDLSRAHRIVEEAQKAVAAKSNDVERQRQTLAQLREELARLPSEIEVASALAAASGDASGRPTPSSFALTDIPPDFLDLYRRAALTCPGLSWTVLAAIGSTESSHGRADLDGVRSGANFAGAMGPMQFLGETWAAYGVDGNGDGNLDVYDATDAAFGAAKYLCANGAGDPSRLAEAIWAYNHADWYVVAVLSRAAAYGTPGLGSATFDAVALVDHPNLTLSADARADLLSGAADPRVVATLAAAVVEHRIAVSVIKTGHSPFVRGTDRISNHYLGRGVDIFSVDGVSVSASNQPALRLALAFLTADPSLRPDELGSPWPDLARFPGAFSDADHAGHLHLGWRS